MIKEKVSGIPKEINGSNFSKNALQGKEHIKKYEKSV